jgi:hypothetical protein
MPKSGSARLGPVELIASCLTLFSVAVTLPVLDLLGRNPEFFVAHRMSGGDIAVMAVALALLVPLLLAGVVALLDRVDHRAGLTAHGALLVLLGGTIAVVVVKASPLDGLPWWAYGAVAIAAGSGLLVAYRRSANFRWVLRIGAVVPLVLLGLFLFGSRTSALVRPPEAPITAAAEFPADAPPIVMLVFDELPLASIVDGNGRIQSGPYPNLARLAGDGTWYRDATTVASHTTWAVPAILTGMVASTDSVPTVTDHPDNLFTWAAGGYEMRVVEPVTLLCPSSLCEHPGDDAAGRWKALWSDLRVVLGHLFLPDDVVERLPPIDQNWTGFEREASDAGTAGSESFVMKERFVEARDSDRRTQVAALVDLIGPSGERPPLYFGHFLLPHGPWQYLPDGHRYNSVAVDNTGPHGSWSTNEWAVVQAYQRHLAQAEYADNVVGQVIDRLEEVGIYDEAVVVVVADHGVAIRPGVEVRRRLDSETVADVAAVPLIIKAPGQNGPVVDDYPASTIDVLPTVADIVGTELSWDAEGTSLIAADRPPRPTRTYVPVTGEQTVVWTSPFADVVALGAGRVEWFGDRGVFGLAPPGYGGLLGRDVSDLEAAPASGRWAAKILNAGDYENVAVADDVLPVATKVRLSGPGAEADEVVAVALNGTVTAVALTYEIEGEEPLFMTAMMNPAHLVEGTNRIELFHVTGAGAEPTLQRIEVTGSTS